MRRPPVNPGVGPSIMSLLSSAELTALLEGNLPADDRRNEIVEEIGQDSLRMRLPVLDSHLSHDLPPGSVKWSLLVLIVTSESSRRPYGVMMDALAPCLNQYERITIPNAAHAMNRANPQALTGAVLEFFGLH